MFFYAAQAFTHLRRIGAGRCVAEGCKRSKPLGVGRDVEKTRSVLSIDVTHWVYGFFVGIILAVPIGFALDVPLLTRMFLVLLFGAIVGGIKAHVS